MEFMYNVILTTGTAFILSTVFAGRVKIIPWDYILASYAGGVLLSYIFVYGQPLGFVQLGTIWDSLIKGSFTGNIFGCLTYRGALRYLRDM